MIRHLEILIACLYFHSKKSIDDLIRNFLNKYSMSLLEIKDFNALIENKTFFNQPVKTNKKCMKSLLKFQEIMTIQQESYYIICIIKSIRNSQV